MDPELLQQLSAAGMTDEQLKLLQPRLQMGQQWMQPQTAQGAHVGQTYVAASPLEHLSNAIRQIVGAKMARGAMDQQQQLLGQQRQAVQSGLGALQTAQSGGQGGTLGEAGGGMARPPDPEAAQQIQTAMMGSGVPQLQNAAQFLRQASQFQQQHGPQAALGGVSPNVYEAQTKREALTRPEWEVNPMNGQFYNRRGATPPAGGGNANGLSPEALDQAARMFQMTGQLPQMGMGSAGAAIRRQIVNRSAEMDPSANIAANKAGYHSDSASLANSQKLLDNAQSWERTGKANLNVLLGIAQKLKDTGSPWINSPVRTFMEKGIGDPNQTAFKAAHATVVNEYAKILSGAQGSSGVTDSARHEADSMLPLNATWDQLEAAAKVLDTDAGNRIGAAQQQVQQIRGRMGGVGGAAPASASPAPAAAPAPAGSPQIQKWQQNKAKGVKRPVYQDGSYGPEQSL